jgi:exodeoxyribonuclease VII small subunit
MNENPSFETALAELEQIIRALEDGAITLEVGLARYERGVALLKVCYAHLRDAEARISLLAGLDSEGNPVLKPFEHEASDAAAKEKPQRTARSKPNSGLY